MWYGIEEYLLFALGLAVVAHALSRSYLLGAFGGAAACSMLNLVHEAWLADWQVNPGWAPPLFVAGFVLALPAFWAVGLPFLAARSLLWAAAWQRSADEQRQVLLRQLKDRLVADGGHVPRSP